MCFALPSFLLLRNVKNDMISCSDEYYDENIKGLDVLTNAGLNSPFSEEAFISIVS